MVHVEGDVNPVRDLEIIQDELRLKDVEHLTKRLAELEKVYTRGGEKKVKISIKYYLSVELDYQTFSNKFA